MPCTLSTGYVTAFWLCQKMERKMKDKTIIGIAMIVAIAG
jgi:hypothetical protein